MGLWARTGEHKELGSNDLLASQKCFVQYVYETTSSPHWAPKGTYIIVGNKELLASESRSRAGALTRGHLDQLASDIDTAIRGKYMFFDILSNVLFSYEMFCSPIRLTLKSLDDQTLHHWCT